MMGRILRTAVLATALLVAPVAAQDALAPTHTGESGLFEVISGTTLPQGSWSFSLYYNNFDRLVTVPAGVSELELDVDWHRLSASVGYAFTDTFEMSVMAPYESYDFDGDFADDPDGLGQVRIGAKWMVAGDRTGGFALHGFLLAPTGDEEVGGDETGFGAGIAWNGGNWYTNLGYIDRGDPDHFDRPEEVVARLGHAFPVNDNFFWLTELNGTFYTGSTGPGGVDWDDAVDFVTGGRVFFGQGSDWAFNFALRTDLLQWDDVSDHCPIGGLLGLTFAPRFAPEPPPAPAPPPPPPPPAPAPEPEPAPAPEPPPPTPEERVTIPFDQGARLNNIAKARLDEVALKMRQDPDLDAHVIGYTDSTGSDAVNQRMSEQRAQAVKDYLVQRHSVDARRITTEGRGPADPVASNDTAAGRQQNRRAVVILRVD